MNRMNKGSTPLFTFDIYDLNDFNFLTSSILSPTPWNIIASITTLGFFKLFFLVVV